MGGVGGVGGPWDFSVSPSPFGLDFGTLDFGTSDLGLTIRTGIIEIKESWGEEKSWQLGENLFHKQIFTDKSYEWYTIANTKNEKGFKNKKINLKQTGNEYLPK